MESRPADEPIELHCTEDLRSMHEHKIIINSGSGEVIKGYVELSVDMDSLATVDVLSKAVFGVLPVKVLGTKTMVGIRLTDVKSAYFVKSFRGNPQRKDLRFYSNGPTVRSVWVEIRFKDNEILEGLIDNSVDHLLGEGFLLRPSDVECNNVAIYINKAAIAGYRVLGVRALRNLAK